MTSPISNSEELKTDILKQIMQLESLEILSEEESSRYEELKRQIALLDNQAPEQLSEGLTSVTALSNGGSSASGSVSITSEYERHGLDKALTSEQAGVPDLPLSSIKDNRLGRGFEELVQTLAELIIFPDTLTPLTIGIDGPWGSGKTSIMRMLQSRLEPSGSKAVKLRDFGPFAIVFVWIITLLVSALIIWLLNPWLVIVPVAPAGIYTYRVWSSKTKNIPNRREVVTVWFNAWRYNQEEQIWAALAVAILDQIKERLPWYIKIVFPLSLLNNRLKKVEVFKQILSKLAPSLSLLAVSIVIVLVSEFFKPNINGQDAIQVAGWSFLLPVAGIVFQVISNVKDPFKLNFKELIDNPRYEDKIGFIEKFDKDFKRIVEVVTRPSSWRQQKRLVIFVDDLDRCRPLQAAGVIEAISLMLNSEHCIFLMGMDFSTVAASIEVKYKDLTEKLRKDTPGVTSPGFLFLDKIIQLPVRVPQPGENALGKLVVDLLEPRPGPAVPSGALPSRLWKRIKVFRSKSTQLDSDDAATTATSATPLDPSGVRKLYNREEFKAAALKGFKLLNNNPRQVKRYINLFRLHARLADRLGLLRAVPGGGGEGLSLEKLAVWLAWSLSWPEFQRYLRDKTFQSEVRNFLAELSSVLEPGGNWVHTSVSPQDFKPALKKIQDRRETEKNLASHWCFLPWEVWLRDTDFLVSLKSMEDFWNQNGQSWLQDLLELTGEVI